jgi:hypothetical protein
MSLSRTFTPALRSGLVLTAGALLIVTPLAVGLSHAAAATGLATGVLAIALGLAGTADAGRGTLPLSSQAAYDAGLGVGLFLAGVLFGLGGELGAMALFAAMGLALLAITSSTVYSLRTTPDFLE